ncbi:MAG: hypothetical protein GVY35_11995 [Bacteroidetes bacterium]|jgi:hypothetical protein|nr:hypothetical protein [Bacteroidota bacterium]
MEEVAVFLVPISFFAAIVWIVKIVSDNRIRRKVLDQRVSDELAEAILKKDTSRPSALGALKWGLIVIGLGGALVLLEMFSVDVDEPLAYGLMFLAAGGGLVAYYLIAAEDEEKAAARDEEYVPDFSSSEEL